LSDAEFVILRSDSAEWWIDSLSFSQWIAYMEILEGFAMIRLRRTVR